MLDFRLRIVNRERDLAQLVARLASLPVVALDIETANWWDKARERVSLVQLAFREVGGLRVAIVDAFAEVGVEQLRFSLERTATTKAIHNAAYDAVRLSRHYGIQTAPVHDTMTAARHSGERRYSLRAQAQAHLGITLDKGERQSDWSRRPLAPEQLRYAALDAACTLLLYEDQVARGLVGAYRLRDDSGRTQTPLPLGDASPLPTPDLTEPPTVAARQKLPPDGLPASTLALLGVVTEMAGRYSPERLAVSADGERVGLAGWIIDRAVGAQGEVDEETAKLAIAELCERGLVRLTAARRLEATEAGARLWHSAKPG